MDTLHRPDEYPFISELVDVMDFFVQGKALKEELVSLTRGGDEDEGTSRRESYDDAFAKRMGCSQETMNELKSLCDPARLKCGLEQEHDPLNGVIPAEGKESLVTLEIQARELEKRKTTLSYRQMACQLHKYKRTNFQLLDGFRERNELKKLRHGYVPPDVLMNVSLAKPYNRVLEYHEIRLGRLLTMDSMYQVLGHLPLTALRDKISCQGDWSVMKDLSDTPDALPNELAKDKNPSGFFYINGVFYNDTRNGEMFELSEPIIEWAKRRSDEVGPFTSACMHETRFVDLKLRLGQPYVYIHQGHCEHLIIFSDLRMMSSSDSQDVPDYPLLISLKPKKRVPCCACKVYTAKWVTYGNKRLPSDPAFFCEACYRAFNYDFDGSKDGKFTATPFFDRSVLP